MGEYYRNVPANTPSGDLLDAMYLCKSFDFERCQSIRRTRGEIVLSDLNKNDCHDLKYLVDALDDATLVLQQKCSEVVNGVAVGLEQTRSNKWQGILLDNLSENKLTKSFDAVIYCPGSVPRSPQMNFVDCKVYGMDMMVDPLYVRSHFGTNPSHRYQTWGVVGSSHSAILIIKNLIECEVENIVNIYRSDLKFQHAVEEGWLKYVYNYFYFAISQYAEFIYFTKHMNI
jgi:hypothetical protein